MSTLQDLLETCGSHLFVDQGSDGQAIEAVSERLPDANVVSALAFVIKSVDSIDGSALVVSSEEEEVLWILDLQQTFNIRWVWTLNGRDMGASCSDEWQA